MTYTETRRLTLADLIQRYIEEVLPDHPKTEKNQTAHLQWWRREIGGCPLDKVRPALLVECRNKLRRGLTSRGTSRSPATVNRYFATLSRVFTIAIKEWEWLDESPLRRLSKLREPPGRSRFLSADERTRLLLACRQSPNRDLYTAVVLAISTGARRMEIMGLRWQDVDLKRGLITLHFTKNGTRRAIPLQGHALELLREKYRRRNDPNAGSLLFPGRRNPKKPANLRVSWENALASSDVENFRWHDLRHTAASYLAMHGATLMEISEILGHRSLEMVKRYTHLSVAHTAGVVAKMNREVFGDQRTQASLFTPRHGGR